MWKVYLERRTSKGGGNGKCSEGSRNESVPRGTFEKHHKYPRGYLIYKRGDSPPKVCAKDYLKQ
jgi:hypothetical protein